MEWTLAMAEKKAAAHEALFGQFLNEANRVMVRAIAKTPQVTDKDMTALFSLNGRLWLVSDEIGRAGRQIVLVIIDEWERKGERARCAAASLYARRY